MVGHRRIIQWKKRKKKKVELIGKNKKINLTVTELAPSSCFVKLIANSIMAVMF